MLNAILQFIQQNPMTVSAMASRLARDEGERRRRKRESAALEAKWRAREAYDEAHPKEAAKRTQRNRKFLKNIYKDLLDREVKRLKTDSRSINLKPTTLVKFARQKMPSNLAKCAKSFERQCKQYISNYKVEQRGRKKNVAIKKVFDKNEAGCIAYAKAYIRIMKNGIRDDVAEMQLMEAVEKNNLTSGAAKKVERFADRCGLDINRMISILADEGEDARLDAIAKRIRECKAYICAINFWGHEGKIAFNPTYYNDDAINSLLNDELDLLEPLEVDSVFEDDEDDADEEENDEDDAEDDEDAWDDDEDEECDVDDEDEDEEDDGEDAEDEEENDEDDAEDEDEEDDEKADDDAVEEDEDEESGESNSLEPIAEAIYHGFSSIKNDSLFLGPGVPKNKLANAVQSMRVQEDKSCLLIDMTLFGGSREGMLLTDKAIYFKEFLADPVRIPLDKIPEVSMNTDGDLCFGDAVCTLHPYFNKAQVREMVAAISQAAALARKQA